MDHGEDGGGRANDGNQRRVLYVDGDGAEATADRLADRLSEAIAVRTVDADDPRSVAERGEWSCLVVGDAIDAADRAALLSAVECPTVLFTSDDPASVPDGVLDRIDTLVERGNGDRSVGFLAEKIKTLLASSTDGVEDALSDALSTVEARSNGATALFVVDEDGHVVWSNQPFEAAFPVETVDATMPDTDDFYTLLDAVVVDIPEAAQLRELDEGTEDHDNRALMVPTDERSRFYLHDQYDHSTVGPGLTLEQFEDITDRAHREARSQLLERLVEQAQDGLYTLDHNGIIDFCNESFAANLGYDRAELLGEHASKTLAPGELERGQETVQHLLDDPEQDSVEIDMTLLTRSGERREMSIHYTLLPTEDDSYGGLMGVVRDVTDRRERERRIEAQRDELSTLNRTNELLQEIISALGTATTRSELQQTVCDRLVESGQYDLAWIGERRGGSDIIVPLTSAGEATEYLDDIEIPIEQDETGRGPGGSAYQSGTVQIVPDIHTDDRFAPWRERAIAAGLESMVAVPLRHGETTHGILAVYATEPDAFSDRIAEGFAVLGETIGLALTAVQNKQLLHRDTTLVLEFRSRSDEACLVWLAAACDCTLETAGAVETDEGVVQYLRVDGAAPQAVVDAVGNEASVTRTEGDQIVEIHAPSSLGVQLSEVGARLQTATARPDGVRIVVEASADADVRAIQNVIERANPDAELASKTERSQPRGDDSVPSPLSALTDRQREVLQAAYLSGYYDWPREQTAEEVAESLDIASPTLHQHLRRAERNLLDRLLDR